MQIEKKPAPADTSYVYVVTRSDLPSQHQVVQACHAAYAASHSFGKHPVPYMVLCTVENEAALTSLFNDLKGRGVPCCSINEPDFVGDPMTAIATGPLRGDERKPLKRLPLLKPNG